MAKTRTNGAKLFDEAIRESKGQDGWMKQREVAALLGCSVSHVSCIKNGWAMPSSLETERIERLFKVKKGEWRNG